MSLNASFPAETHLAINNDWLNDYAGTERYVDCRDLDSTNTGRRQRPRGILVGRNSDDSSSSSDVKMCLWGETQQHVDVYTLANGVVHPLAPKLIYAAGTTGRNIKVLG